MIFRPGTSPILMIHFRFDDQEHTGHIPAFGRLTMTIPSVTAVASLAALGVTYAIAHRRIHYWKQWGADLFEQFHDSILDRLDVDLDMTELTSQ